MISFKDNGLKYLQKMHELILTKEYCTVQSLMIGMMDQGFSTNNTVATVLHRGGILSFSRNGRKKTSVPLEWKGPVPNVKMVNELTFRLSKYTRGRAVAPFTGEQENQDPPSTSIPVGLSAFEKNSGPVKAPVIPHKRSLLEIIIGKGLLRINHMTNDGTLTEFTWPLTDSVRIHMVS